MPLKLPGSLHCRHPIGRVIVFAMALASASLGAWADPMATYQDGQQAAIVLLADPCPGDATGQLKLAYQKNSEDDLRAGCWLFDAQDRPVITWRDGRVQELDAAKVQFEPKYARTTDKKPLDAAPQAEVPPQVVVAPRQSDAPPPASVPFAAAPAPARPAWCKDARRAHELLICRDSELSANDLALIPYWRSYRSRMQLDRTEETRVKNDFYRRQKACGSDRECIGREQAAQMAFYRRALGYE